MILGTGPFHGETALRICPPRLEGGQVDKGAQDPARPRAHLSLCLATLFSSLNHRRRILGTPGLEHAAGLRIWYAAGARCQSEWTPDVQPLLPLRVRG